MVQASELKYLCGLKVVGPGEHSALVFVWIVGGLVFALVVIEVNRTVVY